MKLKKEIIIAFLFCFFIIIIIFPKEKVDKLKLSNLIAYNNNLIKSNIYLSLEYAKQNRYDELEKTLTEAYYTMLTNSQLNSLKNEPTEQNQMKELNKMLNTVKTTQSLTEHQLETLEKIYKEYSK